MRATRTSVAAACLVVVMVAGCSEKTDDSGGSVKSVTTTIAPVVKDCAIAETIMECAPEGTTLAPVLLKVAKRATGEPIKLGTINQDTGAAGAFPELTVGDRVALEFINTELNGLDGHPLELVTCDTEFNPTLSQQCAQEMVDQKVLAVIGGIDVWGDGIKVLEDNGIPYVGGIPVSFLSARSPVSFQFSGGTWGAVLGEAHYAVTELKAKKVAIIYSEFPPITDAAEYGQRYLESVGVEVTVVPTAVIGADMVSAMNQASQGDPDAIIALTADSGCIPTMETAKQLNLKAILMLTGACAAPKIIEGAGAAADDRVFNLETEFDPKFPDNAFYRAIADKYGPKFDYVAVSAGVVSFRSVMNLYVALRAIGAEAASPQAILEYFRASHEAPSFSGHPYSCDGTHFEELPALCSPQSTLASFEDGVVVPLTDWIDVGALVP